MAQHKVKQRPEGVFLSEQEGNILPEQCVSQCERIGPISNSKSKAIAMQFPLTPKSNGVIKKS